MNTNSPPKGPDSMSPEQRALLAVRQMRSKLDAAEQARTEPIAIVGLGCRLPGARDVDAFWRLLCEGRDAVTEVPAERWNADQWYHPDPAARGKASTRWGGFIDDAGDFDPAFFGISPREAVHMDPQQRLFLKVAWEALESAGQTASGLAGSRTGVFVGVHNHSSDYGFLQLSDPTRIDAYTGTGTAHNVIAGRLSYTFDLRGPSLAVDTACSSSLLALHLACQSLRGRECDMAVAGGVNLMLTPEVTICFSRWGMLSPKGRCQAFDAAADGFVRGEGCGVLVLKRLSSALASDDPILALIRGSAVNQDGHTNGLTAPSGVSQEDVIRKALQSANLSPERISYVEAHGTGTSLGDPIEVEALAEVYGKPRAQGGACAVGSVKANIGHLEGAAGIAGVMKVVLALREETIPPQIHFSSLNPRIRLEGTSLRISREALAWKTSPSAEEGRCAAVSSFGWSGTNAHMILSEAPARPTRKEGARRPFSLITLSAKAEGALLQNAGRLSAHLAGAGSGALADIGYTLHQRRSHFGHRLAAVVASTEEAGAVLAAVASAASVAARESIPGALRGYVESGGGKPAVTFLFSGQGAQYRGMGRGLYASEPVFREILDRGDALLRPALPIPLLEAIDAEGDQLSETIFTQPALFALEVALASLWQSWGIRPAAVLGHSVGEYAAACVAGVFSMEDGLNLIAARARAMQALPRAGAMAALFASEERVAAAIARYPQELSIAALNGPTETVISGETAAVQAIEEELAREGIKAQRLPVSHAFHSSLMDSMVAEFERAAQKVRYAAPRIPLVSNLTGEVMTEAPDAGYFCRHLRRTVQFARGLETLRGSGHRIFVEIGPKPVLLAMAGRCLPEDSCVLLPSLRKGKDDLQTMLESLGALYVRGAAVEWSALDRDSGGRMTALPAYAFQEKRFWIETTDRARPARRPDQRPLQGEAIRSPALKGTLVQLSVTASSPAFLEDHRVQGHVVVPATAYVEMALSAAAASFGEGPHALRDLVFQEAMVLPAQGAQTIQVVVEPMSQGRALFQIWSRAEGTQSPFRMHASGSIVDAAREALPARAEAPAFEALPGSIDSGAFYRDLSERGIEYRGSFQSIRELRWGRGEAAAHVVLPDAARGEEGDHHAHPALLDACLQPLLLALAPPEGQTPRDADIHLPISLDRFVLLAKPSGRLLSHARVRRSEAGTSSAAPMAIGDVHVFNDEGSLVAVVEGLHLRRTPRDALRGTSAVQELLYEVEWQPKPRARPRPAPEAASGTWLLFMDSRGIGRSLADRLTKEGAHCVEVSPGAAFERAHGNQLRANPRQPEQIQEVFEEILKPGSPPLRGVVHLWGLDGPADLAQSMLEACPVACGSLLHLVQAMARVEDKITSSSARLWVVTQGAQLASKDPGPLAAAQAALWGLGRVIALEHAGLWGGLVDLEPGAPPDVSSLLAELVDPDGEDQIAHRRGERYAARLVRRAGAARPEPLTIRAEGTYLVTGGLGALGLEVAQWLVTRGARHLVLCGRQGPNESASMALRALERQGAQVVVRAVDIANGADVDRLFEEVGATLPPLRGVVHAAGVLDDGLLRNQSWERFERVLAPKVRGAFLLHHKSASLPLDFFVLFSSMFSVWGAPGQGSYAAANSALAALAHGRKSSGLPALCVDWGAWSGKGMVARMREHDLRRVTERGIRMLEVEQGFLSLEQLLEERATQAGVFAVDWDAFFASLPEGERPRMFSAMAPSAAPRAAAASPEVAPPRWKERLEEARPEDRRGLVLEHVQGLTAQVLRVDRALLEDPRQPLSDLGLDSLLAIELRNAIGASVGRALPATLLFNYPTLLAIADYLVQEVLSFAALPAAPAARRNVGGSAERGEVDVNALSGSELITSFDEELAQIDQWMEGDLR